MKIHFQSVESKNWLTAEDNDGRLSSRTTVCAEWETYDLHYHAIGSLHSVDGEGSINNNALVAIESAHGKFLHCDNNNNARCDFDRNAGIVPLWNIVNVNGGQTIVHDSIVTIAQTIFNPFPNTRWLTVNSNNEVGISQEQNAPAAAKFRVGMMEELVPDEDRIIELFAGESQTLLLGYRLAKNPLPGTSVGMNLRVSGPVGYLGSSHVPVKLEAESFPEVRDISCEVGPMDKDLLGGLTFTVTAIPRGGGNAVQNNILVRRKRHPYLIVQESPVFTNKPPGSSFTLRIQLPQSVFSTLGQGSEIRATLGYLFNASLAGGEVAVKSMRSAGASTNPQPVNFSIIAGPDTRASRGVYIEIREKRQGTSDFVLIRPNIYYPPLTEFYQVL